MWLANYSIVDLFFKAVQIPYEPRHDKTNKMSVRPAMMPKLIWVFAGAMRSLLSAVTLHYLRVPNNCLSFEL